jgi:hypothetical protein
MKWFFRIGGIIIGIGAILIVYISTDAVNLVEGTVIFLGACALGLFAYKWYKAGDEYK